MRRRLNYPDNPGFYTTGGRSPPAEEETQSVTIDNIVLEGVVRANESGGWNAPEKTAETGFAYDTYVTDEPISATVEAWVDNETYERLNDLRSSSTPFPASIDHVNLGRAKLNNLDVESDGSIKSHRRATIEIEEIVEAEVDDAEIWLDTPSGQMGSAAASSSASVAYPRDDETGTTDETSDSGGIVGTLGSIREGLSGVLG